MLKKNSFYALPKFKRLAMNCGGFSLGTQSWIRLKNFDDELLDLCPFVSEKLSDKILREVTGKCIAELISLFPRQIRVIREEKEKKSYEEIFYFRVSSDGDYHFISKHGNKFFHKMGKNPEISEISKEEVYGPAWLGRYDGPLVMLAKPKHALQIPKRDLAFQQHREEAAIMFGFWG